MATKIKPIGYCILIKREKAVEKTTSGILLSPTEPLMEKAEVIAVGDLVEGIKVGNTILFKNYAVDIIEINSEELTFIQKDSILAVIK